MKRFVSAAATLLLFAGTVVAQDRQAKADFTPVSGSDVTGFAQITQLPHGGSLLRIVVRGLDTNASYASFYYEDPGCEGPPDLLGNFTAMPNGTGRSARPSAVVAAGVQATNFAPPNGLAGTLSVLPA